MLRVRPYQIMSETDRVRIRNSMNQKENLNRDHDQVYHKEEHSKT